MQELCTMSDIENVSSAGNDKNGLDFDPDTLRARYQQERDKRIRSDANDFLLRAGPAGRLDFCHVPES